MKPVRRAATYDDLIAVPEHLVAEIVDGELFTSPRPAPRHANATSMIGADLIGLFAGPPGYERGPGGWWILVEPELHLGPDVVVPDLAGWRRERMPALPDTAWFELPPDWLCEVASPSTAALDRGRKLPVYARAGVAHVWLVDPIARTLEVYRRHPTAESWLLIATHVGAERVRAEPFAVAELEIARWWADGS